MNRLKADCALPPKETKILKRAMKCYDQKNYKTGIRLCNQILSIKTLESNVNVLCLQGLMLYYVGKKEEAVKCVKTSLSLNIKSSVAWHSYSIMHKFEQNFEESAKCLVHCSKYDPNDYQILIELWIMQIMTHDFISAVQASKQFLKLKMGSLQCWLAYIVSCEISNNWNFSEKILIRYIESILADATVAKIPAFQFNKIIMFRLEQLNLHGRHELLLEEAHKYLNRILDISRLKELCFISSLKLQKINEALAICVSLLKINPENRLYYQWVFESVPNANKKRVLEYFVKIFPTAIQPRILLLGECKGKDFERYFREFFIYSLESRRPNIFPLVKSLYSDSEKTSLIESVVNDILNQYPANFDQNWLKYFLSHHFTRLNDTKTSLELIDSTPAPFIDGLLLKADIFYKSANISGLLNTLNTVGQIEKFDKNLDSVCCQYLSKIYNQTELRALFEKYSKQENTPFLQYMQDTQHVWFFVCFANSFYKSHNYIQALAICLIFNKIMLKVDVDLMDFHMYAMRKMLAVQYINVAKNPEYHYLYKPYFKITRILVKSIMVLGENKVKPNDFDKLDSDLLKGENIAYDEQSTKKQIAQNLFYLLKFDPSAKNLQIAAEYYSRTNRTFLFLKTLLKLYEEAPQDSCTVYLATKFSAYYKSLELTPLKRKILEPFYSIIDKLTALGSSSISDTDIYKYFYEYKINLFLNKIQFENDEFLKLFNQGISSHTSDWSVCYKIYKKYAHSDECKRSLYILRDMASTMLKLFPDCQLDKSIEYIKK